MEAYKDQAYSNRVIACILKRASQTINNAVNRRTVRTITSDNGSEFSGINELIKDIPDVFCASIGFP